MAIDWTNKAKRDEIKDQAQMARLYPQDGMMHVFEVASTAFHTGAKAQDVLERAMQMIQRQGRRIVDVKPVSHSDKGMTGQAERTTFFIFYE